MNDLVDFLTARLDDKERRARFRLEDTDSQYGAFELDADDALAEVESIRRIVRELSTITEWNWPSQPDGSVPMEYVDALRHILCLLALPYADHDDYREEWAPE
jgi:hypothetical protein